jgi:hypothetical protein
VTDAPKLSRDAVERLAERLRERAQKLAEQLLPGGTRRGDLYRAAPRRTGGHGDSLTVYLRTGKWRHFGGDLEGETHGDMLDLVRLTQRLDPPEARAWALRWLGLAPGAVEFRRTPAEEALARRKAGEAAEKKAEELRRARGDGRDLWIACPKLALDNFAGRYLVDRIPGFERLFGLGWGLSALRFHPALKHPYAAEDRPGGRAFPAMLAYCQFGTGKISTIHRYYLREVAPEPGAAPGAPLKVDVLRAGRDGLDGKLAWCAIEGGFVPVWRGSRHDAATGEVREGWPWKDPRCEDIRGGEVVVCEGVEDALSLALVQPDRRYAAALSLPNFMHIKLPAWARKVVWFADDDGSNEQTPKLLDRALERLEEEGRDVAIARPPKGFKDANAALRGVAA